MLPLALLATAAPLRAQDAAPGSDAGSIKPWGPRLEYTTAPGCGDEETFHHAVASYVEKGADPFDPASPDVLRVTFKKVRGGYRGSVQKIPAQGEPWPEEDWTGATCAEVFREVARLASMRVPELPNVAPAPPPDPAPADPAPSPEPPKPPPDPVASPAPRVAPVPLVLRSKQPPPMDLAITASTALIMTAGFTADVGPALQLSGGLRRDWFSLDLELRGVFPGKAWALEPIPVEERNPEHKDDPVRPVSFDLSQLSAQLVPCVRFATYVAGCGVVGAYTFIKQSSQRTNFNPGWIIGPRLGAEVPFAERFAVFGFAEALFMPHRSGTDFSLPSAPGEKDAANTRWDSPIVSGFFGVGVSAKFQ